MECLKTTRNLSRYADGELSAAERSMMGQHLAACTRCADSARDYRRLRESLRTLPSRTPSAQLAMKLKVLASRERLRRLTRVTFANQIRVWRDYSALWLNNLMRPLMLPVAGGFCSACILFGLLVPDFTHEVHPVRNDVPTALFTEASVRETMPGGVSESDVVIDLHVDESGHMTDYHVISGQNMLQNPTIRRRLESKLLMTQFTPANFFGTPTASKVRVSFRTSRIDVKG